MNEHPTPGVVAERYAATAAATEGRLSAKAMPFGIPDGRPGRFYRFTEDGDLQRVDYAATIYEPGSFVEFLDGDGPSRVRFLFQHGDAGQGWVDAPLGVNALPIGKVDRISEADDGVHVEATFADHELARAVRGLVEMGALNEMSVAVLPVAYDFRSSAEDPAVVYRHVTRAELFDVSVVVWGQFGLDAAITQVYNRTRAALDGEPAPAPTLRDTLETRIREVVETYAGASISKANADTLRSAVSDIRAAADTLRGHADAIESLVDNGVRTSEDDSEAGKDAEANARLAALDERLFDARINN